MARWHHLADVSLDYDEAYSWKLTTFPIAEIASRLAHDLPPPLYFCLLRAWSRLFGGSPEALRSLSVLFGVLTVLAAYFLARELVTDGPDSSRDCRHGAGRNAVSYCGAPRGGASIERQREFAALAAAAFVALSPLQIDFSQRARMYSLGAALTVSSCWLLLKSLERPRPRWQDYVLYALAAAALAYTHSFGLLIVAAQFLHAFAWTANSCGGGLHRVHAAVAFGIVALLYLPWAANALRQCQQVSQAYPSPPFSWNEVGKACYQTLAARWQNKPPSVPIAWCAAAACLLPAVAMLLRRRGGISLVGLCLFVTFDGIVAFSAGVQNVLMPRYLVFANALLLCGLPPLLAASGPRMDLAAGWRLAHALGGSVTAVLVGGMALLCLAHAERRESDARQPGVNEAMAYVHRLQRPGDAIVTANPMVQIVAAAHAADAGPIRVLSLSTRFPYFQGTAVMRDDEFITPDELNAEATDAIWVVDAVGWNVGTYIVDLPHNWVDVAEERFSETTAARGAVVVRRCHRRPSARTNRQSAVRRARVCQYS